MLFLSQDAINRSRRTTTNRAITPSRASDIPAAQVEEPAVAHVAAHQRPRPSENGRDEVGSALQIQIAKRRIAASHLRELTRDTERVRRRVL